MLSTPSSMSVGSGRLSLPAKFDMTSSTEFRMPFVKALHTPGLAQLTVDLANVSYIDSCGIGVLISWHNQCQESGKQLVLENCGGRVRDVLSMMGVKQLLGVS